MTFNEQSDTCYEGGTFKIDIEIPAEYPFKPPKVSFNSDQSTAKIINIFTQIWLIKVVMDVDEIHDKDLASKHQFSDRCNLSGYPKK